MKEQALERGEGRHTRCAGLVAGCLLSLGLASGHAQLAITEVMSSASTNLGPLGATGTTNGSDFVELTNFGTNALDLAGYEISDAKNNPRPLLQEGDPPLLIQPGESVIFVRQRETTNETQFLAWWGSCLPPATRIRFYPRPGISGTAGDSVLLYDASGQLVDRVDLPEGRPGFTFVYDTNCGDFGVFSVEGVGGTCRAAMAGDIGSPGTTCGPVPLQIREPPADLEVCAGMTATLRVKACGLPRPQYQWYANDVAIAGATGSHYTLTNVTPADAGRYRVEVDNGLAVIHTTNATLRVSTDPSPPTVILAPEDFELYEGQTARFTVTVCAFPPPSFQWLSNGVPIDGATEPLLRIPDCRLDQSGTEYCVQITNALGSNGACARLLVSAKPPVRITEIMAGEVPECEENRDWFELTNEGASAVNLLGWRFSDCYSLEGVITNTRPVILGPGESVIFVERMAPKRFVAWWGADNLPPGLKVITYVGFGLNADLGDALYLWNAAATEVVDVIDGRSFAYAVPGVSRYHNIDDCYYGCMSVEGGLGAFRAVECGDLGSPGYTSNPAPRLVGAVRDERGLTVRWHGIIGRTYQLRCKTSLADTDWSPPVAGCVATNTIVVATDPSAGADGQRFYRVEELP